MGKITTSKLKGTDVYYIQTIMDDDVISGSLIHEEHFEYIQKEVKDTVSRVIEGLISNYENLTINEGADYITALNKLKSELEKIEVRKAQTKQQGA